MSDPSLDDQSANRATLREMIGQLEIQALYGILPLLGHPRRLRIIRRSASQLSRGAQDLGAVRFALIARLRAADQRDAERAQVALDELESIFIDIDQVSARRRAEELSDSRDACQPVRPMDFK